MKKQDLKNGMILETKNGDRFILTDKLMLDHSGFMRLIDYDEDMRCKDDEDFDVIKVYRIGHAHSLESMFKDEHLVLLWAREETKLTDREIEVLKSLKVLGYNWIARDKEGKLFVYRNKPKKSWELWLDGGWYWCPTKEDSNIFSFVKWKDNAPTKIDDLLKGE